MSVGFKGMPWEYNQTNFDRNLAVVIGIDRYKNPSIHDLSTPVSDARALADLLETEYEYKPENVVRLFDEAATLTGLQTLLNDTLTHRLKPTKSDRLIFYFAGHGIPRNSKEGPEGYLVPQDADWQQEGSFLPMSEVYKALSQLECHHLLVILDCCFAGTFRWAGRRKMIPILETVRKEHYDRFIRYPAWQIITSAAHDQEALDVAKLAEDKRGAVADEKQELHSPFALALLEGLRSNKADVIPDGVITAHELYLYLDQQVSELSGDRQKPGIYPMRLEYDRGEFVFTRPGFTSEQLKPAPLLNESNNPYRGLASFDEKHARFFFGRKTLVEELQRRLSQPNRSLTVVLGASGSGKSSLVKAGLIPDLRQESKWYILNPMRPDRSPFTALARAILPIVQPESIKQLSQVSFLDEAFKSKDESGQDRGDESTDAAFVKLAESWNSATPEAKLLLVVDYFNQIQAWCRNLQEKEQLSQLYRAIFEHLESLSNRLQNDPQHFTSAIAKWSKTHPDAKLMLTIDQFEELITMSQESQTETHGGDRQEGDSPNETIGDRAAEPQPWLPFLQVLRGAIVECQKQLHIVLTLRSDFEPRFLSSPLSAYWQDARFPVRAMNSDELRQAIEGPALKQALYFEPPELVGKLIDEVGQMPGALPLLSFTLSELYIKLYERWTKDRSTDRALRIKDYEELGGVAGALTRRATEEYENLIREFGETSGKAYQATMRRVMLRMVTIEGGGVARRRVSESELVYPDAEENKRVAQVIDRLVKARLLVKGQETGEPYVEPAHDFLVRGWDKLQKWIKESQENLVLRERLTRQANDWHIATLASIDHENNKPAIGLLWNNDPRLDQLKEITDSEIENWLNDLETEFVRCSLDQKLSIEEDLREQLRREKKLRITAELREKAANIPEILHLNPLKALINAIQMTGENLDNLPDHLLPPVQVRLREMGENARISIPAEGHIGYVACIAISSNSQWIVSGSSEDGTLRIWDVQSATLLNTLEAGEGSISCTAISPDNQWIVSGSWKDKTLKVWDAQSGTPRYTLEGHGDGVDCVAISPDSQWIVSGSRDNTLKVWDAQSGTLRYTLEGHGDGVNCVVISPNSQWIVSGNNSRRSNKLRVWDAQSGTLRHTLEGFYFSQCVAISPDSQWIVTGGYSVSIWDVQSGTLLNTLETGNKRISCITISPDNQWIVSGSGIGNITKGTVKVWDIKTGTLQNTIELPESVVDCVAISPDSQWIVSASSGEGQIGDRDSKLRIWDTRSGMLRNVLENPGVQLVAVAISSDNKWIVSSIYEYDKAFRVWDAQSATLSYSLERHGGSLEGHGNSVNCVAINPDNQSIVSGGADKTLRVWDAHNGTLLHTLKAQYGIDYFAISLNGEFIVSASRSDEDKTVKIWDIKNGSHRLTLEGHKSFITCVAISPDNQWVASSSYDGSLKVWDAHNGTLLHNFKSQYTCDYVAISPDSQWIVSIDASNLRIWDVQSGTLRQTLEGLEQFVSHKCIVISRDSQWIVCVAGVPTQSMRKRDNTVTVWDSKNGILRHKLEGQEQNDFTCVAISPDSQWIVSGCEDTTLKVWDIQSGTLQYILEGHENSITCVAISPDSQLIVSGSGNLIDGVPCKSNDRNLKVWDAKSGTLLHTFEGHVGGVKCVAISPDSQWIVSSGGDNAVRVWRVGLLSYLRVCCDRLRHHPVFKNPQTETEKAACEICQKYVWSKSDLRPKP